MLPYQLNQIRFYDRVDVEMPKRKKTEQLTAIIEREGDGYVALCPELDIASQGATVEESRENLREALELFFEAASPSEVRRRLRSEVYITRLDVKVG
jgi:predicted RNase H-like HicB family nuclease